MAYRQNYRTPQQIRNDPNPALEDEMGFAQMEASEAVDKLFSRYELEPNFLRSIVVEAASRLAKKEPKINTEENKEVTSGTTESLL